MEGTRLSVEEEGFSRVKKTKGNVLGGMRKKCHV